jgi:hypothetical protein
MSMKVHGHFIWVAALAALLTDVALAAFKKFNFSLPRF